MHGVCWVNIENALRREDLSFVIRRRYVYVAAARPHERTTQYCIRGMLRWISASSQYKNTLLTGVCPSLCCADICVWSQWTKVV